MLFEYKDKFYIKPLVNKISEVKIIKTSKGFEIKPVGKLISITTAMKKELSEVSIEEAYSRANSKTSNDKSF